MSTKRKKPPLRSLQVLLARSAAEAQHGMTGGNIAHVEHDDWCPALRTQSMLDCICKPLIRIEHVGASDTGG